VNKTESIRQLYLCHLALASLEIRQIQTITRYGYIIFLCSDRFPLMTSWFAG